MSEDTRDILDEAEKVGYLLKVRGLHVACELVSRLADEIRRLRAERDRVKPEPSELPVEQMVKQASYVINSEDAQHGGWAGDLACHVLALADENERLRAELATEKASKVHTFRTVEDHRPGTLAYVKDEAGNVVGYSVKDLPEGPDPDVVITEERHL